MPRKQQQPDIRVTPYVGIKSKGLQEILVTKEDREEKPDGLFYWLKEELDNPGHRQTFLPDRTKFVECNDGWFVIYVDGHKTCFRISPDKVTEIRDILV